LKKKGFQFNQFGKLCELIFYHGLYYSCSPKRIADYSVIALSCGAHG